MGERMFERRGRMAIPFLALAISGASVLPVYGMMDPQCDRPEASKLVPQLSAKHYVENPGPVGRPDVTFFSYSLLDPPSGKVHQIWNSFCNSHPQNAVSFKWEPIGLAHPDLPKGECYCMHSPLNLEHSEIDVLEGKDAYIQFINDSATNRLPASTFVRKGRFTESSPLDNVIDLIRQKAGKVLRDRLQFFSLWKNGIVTLDVSGETDDKFLFAIEMPPSLLEGVKEQFTKRKTIDVFASTISELNIKNRQWIPERILKSGVAAVSQTVSKFYDTVFSAKTAEADPVELQVAVFSNDDARDFIAAAPITIYAPVKR
jgi:hypothetical protein